MWNVECSRQAYMYRCPIQQHSIRMLVPYEHPRLPLWTYHRLERRGGGGRLRIHVQHPSLPPASEPAIWTVAVVACTAVPSHDAYHKLLLMPCDRCSQAFQPVVCTTLMMFTSDHEHHARQGCACGARLCVVRCTHRRVRVCALAMGRLWMA
jgi:hypothetical protein